MAARTTQEWGTQSQMRNTAGCQIGLLNFLNSFLKTHFPANSINQIASNYNRVGAKYFRFLKMLLKRLKKNSNNLLR